MRSAVALLLVAACSEGQLAPRDGGPPPPGEGTDAAVVCAADDDCPFGQACTANGCAAMPITVSDRGCRSDDDCPDGFECAESTGTCVESPLIAPPPPAGTSACTSGETRPCGSKVGTCEYGVEACVNGAWSGACEGEVGPTDELCNGVDDDCDGQTDEGFVGEACTAGSGACEQTGVTVCTDGIVVCDAQPGGGSGEVCNNLDDDCDEIVDDGCDDDGDDYCDAMMTIVGSPSVCPNTVNAATRDCNDGDPSIHPGAAEICGDQRDQNCNGDPSDGCTCDTSIDADLDGIDQCMDCDDSNGAVRPGATERCDGIDNDCDGLFDEGFDADGDTYTTCGTRPGGGLDPAYVDCADNNPNRHPFACELCALGATNNTVACGAANDRGNGVDEDCDGYLDEGCLPCDMTDRDGDGVSECAGDCAPTNGSVSPMRAELCDGLDTDCNVNTVENCGVGDRCNWMGTPPPDECRSDLLCVESLGPSGRPTGNFTCTSLCNFSYAGAGVGDGCEANQACLASLTPTANLHGCTVSGALGTGAVGAACGRDDECRSGFCFGVGSGRYCSDRCGSSAYCGGNTTCQAWSTTASCRRVASFQDRALGASCSDGQTTRCQGGPNTCITIAPNNRICSQVCCRNADCPNNHHCSVRGPDVPTPIPQVVAYDTVPVCWPNGAGTHDRVAGQACTSNGQCRSEFCDRTLGVCVDLCCNDASCPTGLSCESAVIRRPDTHQTIGRACVNLTPAAPLEAL